MQNEPDQVGWASAKALARYDAVRFVEEAVKSGLPLSRALEAAREREWGVRAMAPRPSKTGTTSTGNTVDGAGGHSPQGQGARARVGPGDRGCVLALRRAQPHVYATTLLRQLVEQGVLAPRSVSMSTMYRALAREGLDRRSVRAGSGVLKGPTKAFEFSWANQLWMTDGMWGPSLPVAPGGKPVRTHLLALIDDCSRLCTHGQYYRPAHRMLPGSAQAGAASARPAREAVHG